MGNLTLLQQKTGTERNNVHPLDTINRIKKDKKIQNKGIKKETINNKYKISCHVNLISYSMNGYVGLNG